MKSWSDIRRDAARFAIEWRLAYDEKSQAQSFLMELDEEPIHEQNPVNRKAAERMAALHDALYEIGYTGHALEVYLVRLLFCLFAEDSEIFEGDQFECFIRNHTAPDGSDLATKISALFEALNTPPEQRLRLMDPVLAAFPYINGGLFREHLPMAAFSREMRESLLKCTQLDWSQISPAIFGAMFQGVMNPEERRSLGAHYTSEENILKLLRPLFLDALQEELDHAVALRGPARKRQLNALHEKLASLTFLDPACGCGNFLIITYRELRCLELQVLCALREDDPSQVLDIALLLRVRVDQFSGIELEPFPAEISRVSLWLMDHLCNLEVSKEFGMHYARIPIVDTPHILCANALRVEWGRVGHGPERLIGCAGASGDDSPYLALTCGVDGATPSSRFTRAGAEPCGPGGVDWVRAGARGSQGWQISGFEQVLGAPREAGARGSQGGRGFSYIIGNPPFYGARMMSAEQKSDLVAVFGNSEGVGNLDFVTAWFKKAADLIQGTETRCAFVATNSICQGEQVAILWQPLMREGNIVIDFAYRTFKWRNEAKGVAAVHCVIVGFSWRRLGAGVGGVDDATPSSMAQARAGARGSQDAGAEPGVPSGRYLGPSRRSGLSGMADARGSQGGAGGSKNRTIFDEVGNPVAAHNINGYLVDAPNVFVSSRSKPICDVPEIGIGNKPIDGGNYLFSREEMEAFIAVEPAAEKWFKPWIGAHEFINRYYRYCLWLGECPPHELRQMPLAMKRVEAVVSKAAQAVLDARGLYPDSSLADLYDPLSMPPELVRAHSQFDKVVDRLYGRSFKSDSERVAHLFGREMRGER